ncbi:MAG: trigger factor [Bacteroidota bacterium]
MANIVREDQENLTAVVTVNLAKGDYEPKVDSELKKLRKKLKVKGFRQGKTPLSYVKKIYGNQVLVEEINNVLNEQLNNYLRENEVDILGQPLPVVDDMPDIDVNKIEDLAFKYELGLVPQFEVQGISGDDEVSGYDIKITSELIDREVERIRKQGGKHSNPEDIGENDVLSLEITELDGEEPKEGGLVKTISASVDLIKSEALRTEVMNLKKGDEFKLDINDLEDKSPEDIRKFILGLTEEDVVPGDHFSATINDVNRYELAEMNQELFDKVFGPGEVGSEEQLKEKLEEDLKRYYDSQADGKLYGNIQKHVMETTQFELPDEFLKRWLKVSNEKLTEEQIEAEYESFAENLKWSLIQGKLAEEHDVKITQEDLEQSFQENVKAYFRGAADEDMLKRFTAQMMNDQNSVNKRREELAAERLFAILKEKVKVKKESIEWKAFDELLTK